MKLKLLLILLAFPGFYLSSSGQTTPNKHKAIQEAEDEPTAIPDTIKYSNGVVYIGGVENKKRHGIGSLITPYGDTLYSGGYADGMREGFGKYFFKK